MLRTAAYQHYWTVRGRGFNPKQWRALLRVTNRIVKNALADGIKVKYEAEADEIKIIPMQGDGEILRLFRDDGNAETFNSIRTDMDPYDDVIVSILTAAKKIAPDKIEISSDGGSDVFRRKYAKVEHAIRQVVSFAPGGDGGGAGAGAGAGDGGGAAGDGGAGGSLGNFDVGDGGEQSRAQAFSQAVQGQRFWNPDTQRWNLFQSLPGKVQQRWRRKFDEQWKAQAAKARQRAKEHAEKTKRKTEEARSKAEKGSGPKGPKGKNAMNAQQIREAAIRVAAETDDLQLKQAILMALAGKKLPPEFLKNKIEKGSDADGDGKKDEESKKPWEKEGFEKTLLRAYDRFLSEAQKSVTAFYVANPESKVAAASTAQRVALASQIAKGWVHAAVKDGPLALKAAGSEKGTVVGVIHLEDAIKKASDERTRRALIVASTLRQQMLKVKIAAGEHMAMEELMAAYKYSEEDMEDMEREAGCKLGKKWISDAIKRPGRVREYLGVPEGKDIPMSKLNEAIKKVKGTDNKSLLSALILAKRLKGMKK